MPAKSTAQHCGCLNITFLSKMANSEIKIKMKVLNKSKLKQEKKKYSSGEKIVMRFIYCQWTYSDSSRIFGNGICCEKISSSNESLPVEVAIKCASFQHCTVSELPCFSAIARFCSHISTDYGKIRIISLILITNKNPFVIFQKFSYQSNYPNRWCNFQPVSYWFPALL